MNAKKNISQNENAIGIVLNIQTYYKKYFIKINIFHTF